MRVLPKNISTILISLTLALLVWVAAVQEQNPTRLDEYDQDIPIEVIPPADGLINTVALPETTRLRLLAPESSWDALSPSKFKASIDLSELSQGLNDVPIIVEVSDRRVDILELTPAEVTVNLEQVQTISMPVQIEILDSPPLGYINRTPTANPAMVDITGPASLVSQVNRAVSQIFIRNAKETIQTTRDVTLRDRADQTIRGLEIEPPQIAISIPIEQRLGYKDASVRVVVNGQVASGYRVGNISVEPPTITVVGNPQGLNKIVGLVETAPINLDQATETIVRTVPLKLPDGVATVSSSTPGNGGGPGGVKVTVEITPIEDGISLRRPITQQGIDPNYWWRSSPDQAEVFLSGPIPQLQNLRASDVEVVVDLFELKPGVYKLPSTVFHPEGVRVDAILPDPVEVTIGRSLDVPVVQQGLNPSYSWRSSPERVNVQLLGNSERLQLLNSSDVRVIVDLADLEPGAYKFTPIVFAPGFEVNAISPDRVDISIQLKATPTISATILPVTPEATRSN